MDHTKHNKKEQMDHSKIDYSDHDANPMGMAHHDHHKMIIQDFKKRFWVSTIISIPILIFRPIRFLKPYRSEEN